MIYDVLKRYDERKTTNFLPKSSRPSKLSNKDVQILVKSVNNKTSINQCRLARRFHVLSRIKLQSNYITRKSVPKYRNENRKRRAQLNC